MPEPEGCIHTRVPNALPNAQAMADASESPVEPTSYEVQIMLSGKSCAAAGIAVRLIKAAITAPIPKLKVIASLQIY
jgi:hypothetical protein